MKYKIGQIKNILNKYYDRNRDELKTRKITALKAELKKLEV